MNDALGDRMKLYESREHDRRVMQLLPVCVRLDGKRFSKWTEGLARPFDKRLSEVMVETTRRLVVETSACIGYTQSDEISLVLYTDDPKRQLYLDGRIQKLTSILASMTTAWFNEVARSAIPERRDRVALFDCRVWTVPSREEAANALLWRERDATKNSLSMAARHHYAHDELMDVDASGLHERLHAVGVNWNDYPRFFKRGSFLQRRLVERPFEAEELALLPPKHEAHTNPDLVVVRSTVAEVEMPPFDRVMNRAEVVFEGASPRVASENAGHPGDRSP